MGISPINPFFSPSLQNYWEGGGAAPPVPPLATALSLQPEIVLDLPQVDSHTFFFLNVLKLFGIFLNNEHRRHDE